jgi:hypothetical protein
LATAAELIKGALRRINSYQSGEPLQQPDANDCLETLNDLLDSWSIDKQLIFGSVENIFQLQAGKSMYTIGNPLNTDLGLPNFTGFLTQGSTLITGVQIPEQMIVGGTLTDIQVSVPTGATIVSLNPGSVTGIAFFGPPSGTSATIVGWAGGAVTGLFTFSDGEFRTGSIDALGNASWSPALTGSPGALGGTINTNTISMSLPSTVTQVGADVFSYTIPGDLPIPRPNRITHGFTRFSQLDFTIEVTMSQSRFLEILYKAQPGPWPTVAWYNPLMPYSEITFYQTPGNSADLHLFTDTILSNLTINQTFILPSGYARAIKWALAKEICAEYGYPLTEAIKTHAAEAMAMIKALNALPAEKAKYDRQLLRGTGSRNAGWILFGGYN